MLTRRRNRRRSPIGRGLTGLSGLTPVVANERLMAEQFTRSAINEAWAKSGDNPLNSDASLTDPCHVKIDDTYHVFGGSTEDSPIVITYVAFTDPGDIDAPTEILGEGATDEWDDADVTDPFVVWNAALEKWCLYYTGWNGDSNSQKIGVALADSIEGPYTRYAGNPIMEVASNGLGEVSLFNDAGTWRAVCTMKAGVSGGINLGVGATRYFTSSDGLAWTDVGSITALSTSWEDPCFFRYHGTYHLHLNNGSGILSHWISRLPGSGWIELPVRGVIVIGEAYDDVATYAPSNPTLTGGSWEQFYQAFNSSAETRLALASRSTLNCWTPSDANPSTYFAINSNKLRKTTSAAAAAWQWCLFSEFFKPPYTVEAEITLVTEGDTGYIGGLVLAEISGQLVTVVFDPSANLIYVFGFEEATHGVDYDGGNASVTHTTGVAYRVRARVTATSIDIDFHNGTSWSNSVKTVTSLTILQSRVGAIGYGQNNVLDFDDFSVHRGLIY